MKVYVAEPMPHKHGSKNLRKLIEGVKQSNLEEKGLRILLSLTTSELREAEKELENLERQIQDLYGE